MVGHRIRTGQPHASTFEDKKRRYGELIEIILRRGCTWVSSAALSVSHCSRSPCSLACAWRYSSDTCYHKKIVTTRCECFGPLLNGKSLVCVCVCTCVRSSESFCVMRAFSASKSTYA